MAFKDLFGGHAADYAQYRPDYPPELFAWLAAESPEPDLAVDVGTGSGQAAIGLAAEFSEVIGCDPSADQIASARPHPNVTYRVAPAEATGVAGGAADLLLAAQAFHWFDADAFYAEARRILRPGGLLALATYALSEISPAVDAAVHALYRELDRYWEPERRLVETGYATITVPFPEVEAPAFAMRATWSLDQFIGFLGTWSALRKSRAAEGRDRLAELTPALKTAWGDEPAREVTWPLAVRAFRVG